MASMSARRRQMERGHPPSCMDVKFAGDDRVCGPERSCIHPSGDASRRRQGEYRPWRRTEAVPCIRCPSAMPSIVIGKAPTRQGGQRGGLNGLKHV